VYLVGLTPLAVGLVLWQLLGSDDSPYVPRPSTWWPALHELPAGSSVGASLRATAETFLLALGVAIAVGTAVGLAVGASSRVRRVTRPVLEFLRSMPPPAVVPAAALILGFGRSMAVTTVVLAAVWPIVLNTVASVEGMHSVLRDATTTLRLPAHVRVRRVLAPALVPGLLLGVRVATPVCVIVTLLVEMLTGRSGIGHLLLQAEQNLMPAQTFGLLIVVGAFGLLINAVVAGIEHRVMRLWPPSTSTAAR
jgi:ABC-type nitrate/sulfonate/bicarbonate transport system permease component